MIQSNSTAEIVAHALLQEIINFQQSLPDNSDVAMALTNFNQSTLILVDSIGYIGYNLVTFQGNGQLRQANDFDPTCTTAEFSSLCCAKNCSRCSQETDRFCRRYWPLGNNG